MSYLEKLIKRAVDVNNNLDNNIIGNYRISSRHGYSLYVFDIFKYTQEKSEKNNIVNDKMWVHSITIKIDAYTSKISIYVYVKDEKLLRNCFNVLVDIYPDFNIESFYSELKMTYTGIK